MIVLCIYLIGILVGFIVSTIIASNVEDVIIGCLASLFWFALVPVYLVPVILWTLRKQIVNIIQKYKDSKQEKAIPQQSFAEEEPQNDCAMCGNSIYCSYCGR